MALNTINVEPKVKEKRGGGLFGKIAGGLVGAVGGAFAGNPLAGAKLGMDVGGTAGALIKPGSAKQTSGGLALTKVADQDSEVQLARLLDAQKELLASTKFAFPEKEEVNTQVFTPAIEALRKQRGLA